MEFELDEVEAQVVLDARKLLSRSKPAPGGAEGADADFDQTLWREVADLGWLGIAAPEEFGGSAIGHVGLGCLVSEVGRSLAAIPFTSTAIVIQTLLAHGSPSQKEKYLPPLLSGGLIGALVLSSGPLAFPGDGKEPLCVAAERLTGSAENIPDAPTAGIALVVAHDEDGVEAAYLVKLAAADVSCTATRNLDLGRPYGRLQFDGARAEKLGANGPSALQSVLNIAATFLAFEQVGGADACLEMGISYARERIAYGRQIGSFQAVKHRFVDDYVAIEIARSHAYRAAVALESGDGAAPCAPASAHLAAADAFRAISRDSLFTHGAMGFTWDLDCHRYLRRAEALRKRLGPLRHWEDQVINEIDPANARRKA